MTDHTGIPDYSLDDERVLTTPEEFKALADTVRAPILGLLGQRAMTTKQVAATMGLPKGTAGHHLKVLEAAGLIRVVRTRPVRAITEKYYGLVARLYRLSADGCVPGAPVVSIPPEVTTFPLRQALAEFVPAPEDADDPATFLITHARVPAARAREFAGRLQSLAAEFRQETRPGEPVYGLVAGVYLSNWPALPADAPTDPSHFDIGD